MDNELLLFDRLEAIVVSDVKYDLESNAYLSFSGGKDSTILHYLLDKALPNNHIPRVFIDTGIEYQKIREFVLELAKTDNRFVIIKPSQPIKPMLEKVGYPFKSKEHSLYVQQYQRNGMSKTVDRYLNPSEKRKAYGCPSFLRYQFTSEFQLKLSNRCCFELKKKPVHKWQKENNRTITITGMRKEERGTRNKLTCITRDSKGKVTHFHPLAVVNDEWENWFIEKENIALAPLYCQPYNFKRTGCAGCPYNINLQKDLETLEELLPAERNRCELIWKPVYEEYRRLGYRLKKTEQIKLL